METPLSWLVDMLHDAGTARQEMSRDGLDLMGLTWRDLYYWQECVQPNISPVWARSILKLSAAYAAQAMASREFDCPVPYEPD